MGIYSKIREVNKKNMDKVAVSIKMDDGSRREYSYEKLFEKAEVFFNKLKECAVEKGDRVIIIGENSPEWNAAYLGIMKLKATAVLIDASLSGSEITKLIEKSKSNVVFASPKIMDKIKDLDINAGFVLNIMNDGNNFENNNNEKNKTLHNNIEKYEDVAVIIYSSGTTKSASGIMHTHEALIETITMTAKENNLSCDDRILAILPNTHIYGVITCLLGSMILGGSLHYIDSLNNENIIGAFKEFKPTVFPCVPKVFELFEKQIVKKIESKSATKYMYRAFSPFCSVLRKYTGVNFGKVIFKSIHAGFGGDLRIMTCAGAPLENRASEFYYGTGFNMLITYGLTETNIPLVGNRGNNLTTNTCGKPYPGIDIKIANKDESGAGEIYVKSPYMMKGYFNDEEANKEAFEDGWFKTGDIAALDEKGNIKIVGRSKENIVLATGKKVTPTDIESKYGILTGVQEFVVCGVPALKADYDEIHGFIVKENSKVRDEDILNEIQDKAANLSLYMKLAKVHFVDDIPKTSLQKPKRFLLKKYALENVSNKVNKEDKKELINENVEDVIKEIIIKVGNLDRTLVKIDSKLFKELGVDSLGAIEIAVQIEEKYGVAVDGVFHENITVSEIIKTIKEPKVYKSKLNEIYLKNKQHFHYSIFKFHCGLAHFLYRVKVKNDHNIPNDSGYIICANHVSNIDYLWLAIKFKKNRFSKFSCMAKKELFNNSFLSKLLVDICGMIPVDRAGMNAEVMQVCKNHLKDKWGLLIHPEGTRSKNGELGDFKHGAATISKDANVPIIPAYIKGAFEIFPSGKKMPKLFNWKKMRKYKVEVVYGQPIYPENLSTEEITKLVKNSIMILATE